MDFADYLASLKASSGYRGQLVHIEVIPPRSAEHREPGRPLHPLVAESLRAQGITRLYTHQALALDAARQGQHVMVATPTASGKTLCYNLPVLEAVLADARARALYLYPTKALAQDQLGKLNGLGLLPRVRFAAYDGDTPQEERRAVRRSAHLVLTNPDMLHVGILPYHASWAPFLSGLRYVVLDELHSYRGVFGANVAEVIRRLRRICTLYGSRPQFLASSATIANPTHLFASLTGLEPHLVDHDGAPSGRRVFALWNPPPVGESGERRSAHVDAASLLTGLVARGVRTLVFARARKSAELIVRYAREQLRQSEPGLGDLVRSYRAGYTAAERRSIEQALFRGELLGVASTNALELGVDVGALDATVLTGYPGTIASAWQQAGRSGRGTADSLSVLVAWDDPLDQYLMHHPEYFFGQTVERAVVDPGNPRILAAHLACAAYEQPLGDGDVGLFGAEAAKVVRSMEAAGHLVRRGAQWFYPRLDYPAAAVSIRAATSEAFEIRDAGHGDRLLGTVDTTRVYQTLYPGAIYLHQGESYRVQGLDEAARMAVVRAVEVNYYTQPREVVRLAVAAERRSRQMGSTAASFGDVVVSSQVLGYRRKRLYSDEVLEVADLELPEQEFETEALWFTLPGAATEALARGRLDLAGAIHAAEHAAIGVMPLFSMCDRWDVGGVSSPSHPDTGKATIFIYDGYPGGIGIAEATWERLQELLSAAAEIVASCPCRDGCPSCVQSPKCGNNNEPLDKRGAAWLLRYLAGPGGGGRSEATEG